MGDAHRRLRPLPRPARRERGNAGRVPRLRHRLRPARRSRPDLRGAARIRGHRRRRRPGDAGQDALRREQGRPRPPATSARKSSPFREERMAEFLRVAGAGRAQAEPRTAAPLSAAHALGVGGKAAGDAVGDGPGGPAGVRAIDQCRHDVWRDRTGARPPHSADARQLSDLPGKPDRDVRRTAFHQYYAEYAAHSNTLAATFAGSVHSDVYYAQARNYAGARAMALFPDQVPESVYDNLVAAVRSHLPAVHRYFQLAPPGARSCPTSIITTPTFRSSAA